MVLSISSRRLMKELKEIETKGTPPGIQLLKADDMETWIFLISVLGDETVYKGETFALKLKFEPGYPIDYPQVTFLSDDQYQPPLHPHVYSNGHICASILGSEWSPVLTALSICITIQSMLASCKKKERPPGNDRYVRSAPLNPKLTRWAYEDDTV
ncbi:ubiquitin-conjugating enzyme/RWD-like protein [Kockovaella imperatae]|uniref:Ubiquitin-conjugating enzyme/RWD-like protein n=1 Tax=Kockovaella imperatae TaxID=4999 RepID=A0A1Y1UMA1_9TREE|nr:ubiquitin-conjugating enzyme/RWD-like protein [Kockovaella imperatae]ORX38606.1 ubiquitin-conjugating enzyme/RWD-like protein [Kockovaella imperatae]